MKKEKNMTDNMKKMKPAKNSKGEFLKQEINQQQMKTKENENGPRLFKKMEKAK